MKAYTIFNPEVQRYHKYVFSLHLLKLQDIKGRKACVTSSTPCPVTRSSQNYLKSSKKKSEKKQEIFTENRAIFGRLLNISNSMQAKGHSSEKPFNFKSSYEISQKNRQRQIAFENEKIVKKLIEIKPFLQKKKLDKEYSEYSKRKRRLAKLGSINPVKLSIDNADIN